MLPKDKLRTLVSNDGDIHQNVSMQVRYSLVTRACLRIMQVRP